MGLFDKVFGKEIGDAVSKVVQEVTSEDALGKISDALGDIVGADQQGASSSTAAPQETSSYDWHDIRSEMPSLLATSFASYEAVRGVPASSLGVDAAPCRPYDYCLYLGGAPKAAIMLTDHNRDNNRAFLNARAAAGSAGIPFINFYTHMPNNPEYVVARIAGFLG